MFTETFTDDPGLTLYAYPQNDWQNTAVRVACTEDSGAYSVTVDETIDVTWLVFIGAGAPTDIEQAIWRLDLPEKVIVADATSTNLKAYVGEERSVSVQATDVDGNPISTVGLTLHVTIEDRLKATVATVDDGNIAKDSTNVTFTIPTDATGTARQLLWSLRDDSDLVFVDGILNVAYSPL